MFNQIIYGESPPPLCSDCSVATTTLELQREKCRRGYFELLGNQELLKSDYAAINQSRNEMYIHIPGCLLVRWAVINWSINPLVYQCTQHVALNICHCTFCLQSEKTRYCVSLRCPQWLLYSEIPCLLIMMEKHLSGGSIGTFLCWSFVEFDNRSPKLTFILFLKSVKRGLTLPTSKITPDHPHHSNLPITPILRITLNQSGNAENIRPLHRKVPQANRLVVGWVITSESRLLNDLFASFLCGFFREERRGREGRRESVREGGRGKRERVGGEEERKERRGSGIEREGGRRGRLCVKFSCPGIIRPK